MMYLIGAFLIMLLAVAIVALSYRGKAKAEQYHAELQQRRADAAVSGNAFRQQLDTALESIHETHREETIHETNPAHRAERSDFDNDWRGDARLRDAAGAAGDHTASAAATDSAGATVDSVIRSDLFE